MSFRDMRIGLAKWILHSRLQDLQVFPYFPFFATGPTSYGLKGKDMREILDTLKPMDVLLRRYNHYITSLAVPGYWGHCGIYTGDNNVVHASSREGVHKEDILSFMRADEMLILRAPYLSQEEVERVSYRLELIQGRPYDYIMEFGDDERFSCTELVKFAFKDSPRIMIQTRSSGLYKGTILPDDLIETKLQCVYTSER